MQQDHLFLLSFITIIKLTIHNRSKKRIFLFLFKCDQHYLNIKLCNTLLMYGSIDVFYNLNNHMNS